MALREAMMMMIIIIINYNNFSCDVWLFLYFIKKSTELTLAFMYTSTNILTLAPCFLALYMLIGQTGGGEGEQHFFPLNTLM